MINGATIMDMAILVVAANEKCPQLQTQEHLQSTEILGIKDYIIVQNKIDLVTETKAKENALEIINFTKNTNASNAKIIPTVAQSDSNINIHDLLKEIVLVVVGAQLLMI